MFGELQRVYDIFESIGIENPLSETLSLINIVSGGALANFNVSMLESPEMDLSRIAQKRKEGVPMEYIMGTAPFAGLPLYCSNDTLIPTEYTKLLVNVALGYIEERQKTELLQTVIEVGTGCGNISVLTALLSENVKIIASDISPGALSIAQKNIDRYNLEDRISLIHGDLLLPFCNSEYFEKVDIVLCNPPYIPTMSIEKMPPEIAGHQPRTALDGGPYGINFYRRLAAEAANVLKPGGILIFEVGVGQEGLATRLLRRRGGYGGIECHKDQAGVIRVVSASKQTENDPAMRMPNSGA